MGTGVEVCHELVRAGRKLVPEGLVEARPHGPAPQVQQLERSIGLKDLAMADLEQKVLEMEASTFDGVFVWKISDFSRKRQEAVAGRTPAIFSPGALLGLAAPTPRLGSAAGLLPAPHPPRSYTSAPAASSAQPSAPRWTGGSSRPGVADLGPLPRALGAAC